MRRHFLALLFVAFAAACASSAAPSPAPTFDSVTLERTRCFGFCPDYTVTIRSDGEVVYNGRGFVRVRGQQRAQVDPAELAQLSSLIERANFFSLRDEYRAHISDIPSHTVTVQQGGRTKRVLDYGGTSAGMPAIVREIQDEIDRVANTQQWTARREGDPPFRQ